MRRRTRTAGLAAALVAAAIAVAPTASAADGGTMSSRHVSERDAGATLGIKGAYGSDGRGWGRARPATIFNGGDPSGLVKDIHWSSWGGKVALGEGKNAIFKPRGGYYAQMVTIKLRAIKLQPCPGSDSMGYSELIGRVPNRPGGAYGKSFLWAGNHDLCEKFSE